MKKHLVLTMILLSAGGISAQIVTKDEKKIATEQPAATVKADATLGTVTIKADATPLELAKISLQAHGGDKFKNMKTLQILGTAEVSASPQQTLPASFAFVYAGEKYRIDIPNQMQPLKQVYDGENTYSSINGFSFPPLNRIGLALLPRIEEKGYVVTALGEKFKKKPGFRVTSPEGYYTDFLIDDKNGQVKSYESSYTVGDRTVTTSVAIDKFRTVEGIVVPEVYSQRFELGSLTIYTAFKAKDIKVNGKIDDDVFAMPKN